MTWKASSEDSGEGKFAFVIIGWNNTKPCVITFVKDLLTYKCVVKLYAIHLDASVDRGEYYLS